jgi:hypothetical protein
MSIKTTHEINHRLSEFYLYLLWTAHAFNKARSDATTERMSHTFEALEAALNEVAEKFSDTVLIPTMDKDINPNVCRDLMLKNQLN